MKNFKILATLTIIAMIHFAFVANLFAAQNPTDADSTSSGGSEISYGAEMDLNSKYLWRGINFDDKPVIQPNVWVSYRNFTFGVWSNSATHDNHHSLKPNEVDLTLSYEYSLWNLEFENSLMYYKYYPQQPDSPPTGEFYFAVGYPFGEFKWITNFTIDVIQYAGACYVENGVEFSRALTEDLTLSSFVCLGWGSKKFNETYVGIAKTAMNVFSANFSLNYYPLAFLYLQPHIQFNKTIDNDLYETLSRHSSVYGLLIGVEF